MGALGAIRNRAAVRKSGNSVTWARFARGSPILPGMMTNQNGSLRVTRVAGINIWVHWSWLLLAVVAIDMRRGLYASELWNLAEFLGLFAIVLLHEFGHATACRSVGGQANNIVLWPLGGVAYVSPPQRAGAQLWSIVAGPLVNVVLVPVFMLVPRVLIMTDTFTGGAYLDFWTWLGAMSRLNLALLIFNLLPIYPLDGGQILRCLLWFGVGPRKSLRWSAGLGLVGASALGLWALTNLYFWLAIMAGFLGMNSWRAFQASRLA